MDCDLGKTCNLYFRPYRDALIKGGIFCYCNKLQALHLRRTYYRRMKALLHSTEYSTLNRKKTEVTLNVDEAYKIVADG